jgi:uncharacterized protein
MAKRRLAQRRLAQRRLAQLAQRLAQRVAQLLSEDALASELHGIMDTVVVQPTPFCNIACTYCYLPDRDAKSVIAIDTIKTLFRKIFASPYASPEISVIWHAGEPLVVPVAFYRQAFEAIETLRPEAIDLRHAFQTNGTLLTTEWCDLFRQYDAGVGVSIDGPKPLHDAHRVTRSGRGTFDKTIAGIRLLQREGVPFHVITVVGKDHLDDPDRLIDFYIENGIEDVCFNVEESEGQHVSSLFQDLDLQARYAKFLKHFWSRARGTGRFNFIREIDGLLPLVFRPNEPSVRNEQVIPFAMLNVDCHGAVSTFSPELLGYKNAAYNDFIVGNILADELDHMMHSAAMQAMRRDIDAGVRACQAECGYFSACGGGAPVNKLSERGSFQATRTSYCELTQITPIDVILAAFDRIADDPDAIAALAEASAAAAARWPVTVVT